MNLEGEIIQSVKSVRNLGVITDNELNMKDHISHVSKLCYHQIRNIWKIRNYLSLEATKKLVQALVISRLDYCNSLFYKISEAQLDKLQRIQNSAARLIVQSSKYSSITSTLKDLHWLRIRQRIKYKILTLTFKALKDGRPQYLREMLSISHKPVNLRSNSQNMLTKPPYNLESCGSRCFAVSAPELWNKLPPKLRNYKLLTIPDFKKQLKTVLFKECFNL